jgi:hypothetical protein
MAEYAVMPVADYLDACNAVREKTGGTAAIKSGDMAAQIRAISGGGSSSLETVYVDFSDDVGDFVDYDTETLVGVFYYTDANGNFATELVYGGNGDIVTLTLQVAKNSVVAFHTKANMVVGEDIRVQVAGVTNPGFIWGDIDGDGTDDFNGGSCYVLVPTRNVYIWTE